MKNNAIIAAVVLLVALALVFWAGAMSRQNSAVPNNATSTNGTSTGTPPVATTRIKIALMDPEKNQGTKERGCDAVVLVDREVPATTQPLNAALRELFAETDLWINGLYNFISKTRDTLLFDRAEVESGTARIYLTGRLTGLAGVCDDPRARAQIEETALQFPTVERVEIYLNGSSTTLTPDLRG